MLLHILTLTAGKVCRSVISALKRFSILFFIPFYVSFRISIKDILGLGKFAVLEEEQTTTLISEPQLLSERSFQSP